MFKREHFKETNKGKVAKAKAVHCAEPATSQWEPRYEQRNKTVLNLKVINILENAIITFIMLHLLLFVKVKYFR